MTTTNCIRYKDGYKYWLVEDYQCMVQVFPKKNIDTPYVSLTMSGILLIKQGFAWDGPSGPTIDRSTNMRGSLVHDALYRLIRLGELPLDARLYADDELKKCWIEDGMWPWMARIEAALVRRFGKSAARPSAEPKVMQAP